MVNKAVTTRFVARLLLLVGIVVGIALSPALVKADGECTWCDTNHCTPVDSSHKDGHSGTCEEHPDGCSWFGDKCSFGA
jgi:hypothetical protein